jgi:hypothetical protein
MNTTPPPLQKPSLIVQPLEGKPSLFSTLDTLLKKPGSIVHGIAMGETPRLRLWLAVIGACSMLVFGLVVGSFSGGMQWWAAPLKISLGQVCACVLCLPSLYVFVAMTGSQEKFSAVLGLLIAASALMGVLLAAFGPVIWLFSQSTESVSFMTVLCLAVWFIAGAFAVVFLFRAFASLGNTVGGPLKTWVLIFALVSLQMITALRPILGTPAGDQLLPSTKMSFLEHFFSSLGGDEVMKKERR